RFRTPVVAVLSTIAIMLVLTLSGTFVRLLTVSIISRLVTYLITCSAVPVLRRRATAPAAAFLMPAGLPMAIGGMALAVWLLSNSTLREARDTAIAAGAGLTIYWLCRKR